MKKYLLLLLLATTLLNSASFDCRKASTKIEKAICVDETLSNLDYQLSETYMDLKVLVARNKVSQYNINSLMHFFIQTQRKWVKNRNKSCKKYETDELKSCLLDHYSHRVKKLKSFSEDASLKHKSFKNVLYLYNHVPYMRDSFKELLDKEEYAKFLKQYNKREESYGVCVDKYGVMQENCVLEVAKKNTYYYENLLESYRNRKYLVEDGKVTLIQRHFKSFINEYDYGDESDNRACLSYKYYPQSEYKKLFHIDINSTKIIDDMKFEKPDNENNLTTCNSDDSRYHHSEGQSIEYISKNVVVFMSEVYSYSGGAHGDYESLYTTVDRNSAKYISWEDIFGQERKLYDFIMKKMDYLVLYTDMYKESEYYDMATSRMYITKDGIVIRFGVYEITTYDQGEPSFLIPLKLLKKTLSKEKYNYYFSQEKSVKFKVLFKK